MNSHRWCLALLLVACTKANPGLGRQPGEQCTTPQSCARGSYSLCVLGDECRYLASDGDSFACASCQSCSLAQLAAESWCAGNGGTNGSTNGGTNGSTNGGTNGSTNGGTNGSTNGGTNGSTNGGTNGSTNGGTNGGPICTVQDFTLSRDAAPEVVLVQDRSGSMEAEPDGTDTGTVTDPLSKWVQMKAAIKQVVSSTSTIEWGLELFPQVGQDSVGNGCNVGASLDVGVGAGTSGSIGIALDATSPGGTTPTAAALNAAVKAFSSSDGRPHYIVLATDGEPTCSLDAQMLDDPTTDAVASVKAAVSAGVHVFVVGIGTDPTDQATLTTLANDGGEPNTAAGGKAYYEVSSTGDLESVLDKIAGQITACSFALPQQPMQPDFVTVASNGKTVPRDQGHLDGWDFGPGDASVIFYGNSCNGLGNISAVFGCP